MLSGALDLLQSVGIASACAALGIPRSSFYHAQQASVPPAPPQPRPSSPRALSAAERQEVRQVLNSERFVDRAPRTVYAILLDEGRYLCSWRTMYRVLAADAATQERRAQRRQKAYARPELLATGPCQVWSWDSTKLRGPLPGLWYSLYVIRDIFSRKIVGWLIAEREDANLAEVLIAESCAREGSVPQQLTLHADRGASMTSKTVAELLIDLGVVRSHSRPTVSNDTPYSEAQFKTMKYGPWYPERFASIEAARVWMRAFTTWYNTEHRHSGIGLLPPQVVHSGQAPAQLAARQRVVDDVYHVHPERFVRGHPHAPAVPTVVGINLPHPSVVVATPTTAALLPAAAPASGGNSASGP
jgi:putative transposase